MFQMCSMFTPLHFHSARTFDLVVAEIGGGTKSCSGKGFGLGKTRVAHVVVGELLPRFQKKSISILGKNHELNSHYYIL
jgi:hypothetical protein